MVIGTAPGWSNAAIVVPSIARSLVFDYSNAIVLVLRSGLALAAAAEVASAADTLSITVMEIVENAIMSAIPAGAAGLPVAQPAVGSGTPPRAAVTRTPIPNTSMRTWKAGTAIRWSPLSRPL
jgi:hypothetical protein